MKPTAVSMMQVDASLAFPINDKFEDSGIRTGADEGSDCPAFELKPEWLTWAFAMEQRASQVS